MENPESNALKENLNASAEHPISTSNPENSEMPLKKGFFEKETSSLKSSVMHGGSLSGLLNEENPKRMCFICQTLVNPDDFLKRVIITVPITQKEKIKRLKINNPDNLKCVVLCIDCAKHILSELNSLNIKGQNLEKIEFPMTYIKKGQLPTFPISQLKTGLKLKTNLEAVPVTLEELMKKHEKICKLPMRQIRAFTWQCPKCNLCYGEKI